MRLFICILLLVFLSSNCNNKLSYISYMLHPYNIGYSHIYIYIYIYIYISHHILSSNIYKCLLISKFTIHITRTLSSHSSAEYTLCTLYININVYENVIDGASPLQYTVYSVYIYILYTVYPSRGDWTLLIIHLSTVYHLRPAPFSDYSPPYSPPHPLHPTHSIPPVATHQQYGKR